jgi:hypothetical protein
MKTHARHNPILDQKLRTEVAKIGRPLVVADAEEETNRAALRSEQKLRGNELRIYSRWIGTAEEELQLGREGDAASHLAGGGTCLPGDRDECWLAGGGRATGIRL